MPDVRLSDRRRVAALREMGLLTDTPEEAYDRFTRLAAQIVETPIALFTVITEDEQFFRSQVGLPEPVATTRRTPLSHSFCQYVILSSAPLEVTDAREHPTVKGNPAIEELQVIAYLGVPLITRRGETLGSLCAIDREPREWTQRDRKGRTTGRKTNVAYTTDLVRGLDVYEVDLPGTEPQETQLPALP